MREAKITEEAPGGFSMRSISAPPNNALRNNIWGPAPVNQICSVSVASYYFYFFVEMMFDDAGSVVNIPLILLANSSPTFLAMHFPGFFFFCGIALRTELVQLIAKIFW